MEGLVPADYLEFMATPIAQTPQKNLCELMLVINNERDAILAAERGANYLGLVPSETAPHTARRIRWFLELVPSAVKTVLVTDAGDVARIVRDVLAYEAHVLELRSPVVGLEQIKHLKQLLPDIGVIKVISVHGTGFMGDMDRQQALSWTIAQGIRQIERYVRDSRDLGLLAIKVDTTDPETRQVGWPGLTHDKAISRLVAEQFGHQIKVWIAGGLNIDNLTEVLATVRPSGIDVGPLPIIGRECLDYRRLEEIRACVDDFNSGRVRMENGRSSDDPGIRLRHYSASESRVRSRDHDFQAGERLS